MFPGSSLSGEYPMKKFFPKASKFHLSLITTGESSGNLDETLKLISEMINENRRIKSELISTLTYPVILFFSMLLLLYFILEFALPRMLNVMDLSGKIPLPTTILLISGNVLPTVIIAIFYFLVYYISILTWYCNKNTNNGRNTISLPRL